MYVAYSYTAKTEARVALTQFHLRDKYSTQITDVGNEQPEEQLHTHSYSW